MTEPRWMLLADDDPDDVEMLCDAIISLYPSVNIKTFPDGRSLIRFLETCSGLVPCTIVIDFNMPGMSGLDVLRELCNSPVMAPVPKLIWSTSDMPEQIRYCLQSGAMDYLVKPTNPSEFPGLAKKIIGYYLEQCHIKE